MALVAWFASLVYLPLLDVVQMGSNEGLFPLNKLTSKHFITPKFIEALQAIKTLLKAGVRCPGTPSFFLYSSYSPTKYLILPNFIHLYAKYLFALI